MKKVLLIILVLLAALLMAMLLLRGQPCSLLEDVSAVQEETELICLLNLSGCGCASDYENQAISAGGHGWTYWHALSGRMPDHLIKDFSGE